MARTPRAVLTAFILLASGAAVLDPQVLASDDVCSGRGDACSLNALQRTSPAKVPQNALTPEQSKAARLVALERTLQTVAREAQVGGDRQAGPHTGLKLRAPDAVDALEILVVPAAVQLALQESKVAADAAEAKGEQWPVFSSHALDDVTAAVTEGFFNVTEGLKNILPGVTDVVDVVEMVFDASTTAIHDALARVQADAAAGLPFVPFNVTGLQSLAEDLAERLEESAGATPDRPEGSEAAADVEKVEDALGVLANQTQNFSSFHDAQAAAMQAAEGVARAVNSTFAQLTASSQAAVAEVVASLALNQRAAEAAAVLAQQRVQQRRRHQ